MNSRSKPAFKKSAISKPALRKPNTKTAKAKPSKRSPAKSSLAKHSDAKPASKTGKLPEWNLADLYSEVDAPEVARDLANIGADCVAYETDYSEMFATAIGNE